jgi:hypothetical protein
MDDLIGALIMFIQQHRTNTSGLRATKALKGIVDKIRKVSQGFEGLCLLDGTASGFRYYHDGNIWLGCSF